MCVDFFYYMFGANMGEFNVNLYDGKGNKIKNIWSMNSDQGTNKF